MDSPLPPTLARGEPFNGSQDATTVYGASVRLPQRPQCMYGRVCVGLLQRLWVCCTLCLVAFGTHWSGAGLSSGMQERKANSMVRADGGARRLSHCGQNVQILSIYYGEFLHHK